MTTFDASLAQERLRQFWRLQSQFGIEKNANQVFLNEIVTDRYVLCKGLQLLFDELQLVDPDTAGEDLVACGADLSLPSVITTLAHTNCGDRIHQGEAMTTYHKIVAQRFATMSEIGELKLEAFFPIGGGIDDGETLAHVTVAHQLDEPLRARLYRGNSSSFVLVNFDLKTHVGRLDSGDGKVTFGTTQESKWREPRAACGAIVNTLSNFDPNNSVHRRLREQLGEENFRYLTECGAKTLEGIEIREVVAAAIIVVRGLHETAAALTKQLDERGLAHLTASTTVNRPHLEDTILYHARATVFGGEVTVQGLGLDARLYSGRLSERQGDRRLLLTYDGRDAAAHHPSVVQHYRPVAWKGSESGARA